MASRGWSLQAVVAVLGVVAAGCVDRPSTTEPKVFVGRYADDVSFQPFKSTSGGNVVPDATTCRPDTTLYCPDGGASLKVTVPGPGDPNNVFAGGAFVAGLPRNLSGYDAVTFWAKASRPAPLIVGLGSDNSGTSLYQAEWTTDLGTEWTQYLLPIPLPVKLASERGLLYFAAGADGSPATGFTFWLNDIQYVNLGGTLGSPAPVVPAACVKKSVGDAAFAAFASSAMIPVVFDVPDPAAPGVTTTELIAASTRYFTFSSTNPAVASVDPSGVVSVQGPGTAVVTAVLGGWDAAGPLTVKVDTTDACPALAAPTDVAPTPTLPAEDVISMFSSAYPSSPGINWHTDWSGCCSEYAQVNVGTHPVKKYTLHTFAGIEFIGANGVNEIDASQMTFFHLDVWTPNAYALGVRLVNDPGGYQSESTVTVGPPTLVTGRWVGVEIPMTEFRNLGGTAKLGQMLFLAPDGTSADVYVDNVYFHR
jgi:hypothetical protein